MQKFSARIFLKLQYMQLRQYTIYMYMYSTGWVWCSVSVPVHNTGDCMNTTY